MRAVRVHIAQINKMLIFALAFFFVCTALVSDSSALTLTQDVSLLSVYSTGLTVAGPGIYVDNQEIITAPQSGSTVSSIVLNFRNMSCANGNYLQTNINVFRLTDNDALNTWVNSLYGGNNDFSFIDTEYEQLTQNTAQIRITLACTTTFINQNKYLSLTSTTSNYLYLYQYDNLSVIYTSRFNVNNSAVDAHETAENLYQINQKVDDLITHLGNNSQSLNTINNNIDSVNDSISAANDDANQRYEDEKDTINQNGDDAVDAWGDASDDLTFSAPTFLFGWLWSLGSVENCVDISVLASLIHSPETQYCTWYPTSIRSIISPIINIFLVCLISGFVFSWLKKGGV